MKFDVIHADPPWRYDDKSRNRGGAERHYKTMSLEELKAMNVADYAAKNSCLLMWTTGPQLADSIELMRSWGFQYRTFGFVWVKRSKNHWFNVARRIRQHLRGMFGAKKEVKLTELLKQISPELMMEEVKDHWFWGMGSFTRACAEVVLIGVKGAPAAMRHDKGVHQVIEAVVGAHSAKPDEVYDRIERLFGPNAKRLDMFTRRNRPGWMALGDQVGRSDYMICPVTFQILPVLREPEQERQCELHERISHCECG